jgi:hypothetical protein
MAVKIILTGPVFDGQAEVAARDFVRSLTAEIADIGRDWIKLDTERMDKSGRGGTGAAAGGVKVAGAGGQFVVSGGIREGEYAWPWLEGTSRRNQTTGFKGYHSFRRTTLRMRKQVTPFAQAELAGFISRMGG